MNTNLKKLPLSLLAFSARGYLSTKAWSGKTVTYEELAHRLTQHNDEEHAPFPIAGSAMATAIAEVLTAVYDWCKEHELPELTAIVVRKSGQHKGIPGKGFWALMGENMDDYTTAELREKHQAILATVYDFWDI